MPRAFRVTFQNHSNMQKAVRCIKRAAFCVNLRGAHCASAECALDFGLAQSGNVLLSQVFPHVLDPPPAAHMVEPNRYRQVLCANSFTSLAELSLHRAGKPALNYLVAEDRERVKGGEAACEALDVNSVFCYQPASSSCISMYFMLMYFFPPHWVPAT